MKSNSRFKAGSFIHRQKRAAAQKSFHQPSRCCLHYTHIFCFDLGGGGSHLRTFASTSCRCCQTSLFIGNAIKICSASTTARRGLCAVRTGFCSIWLMELWILQAKVLYINYLNYGIFIINGSINQFKLVADVLANLCIPPPAPKTEPCKSMWWFSKILGHYLSSINIGRPFNCESVTITLG